MFVASRVYNYATGASAAPAGPKSDSTPANSRVKRHPRKAAGAPASPPPSYASVAANADSASSSSSIDARLGQEALADHGKGARSTAELAKIAVIDEIIRQEDLYDVLAVKRNAKGEEIRRGFLNRSRVCHPDKLPNYAPCVVAFQKVSFAYQTLSKPSSRRMYDVSGRTDLAAALNQSGTSTTGFESSGVASDETLNGVLYSVFCEFLEGDFEMIRVLVNALNEGNPGLNLGEEAVDSIEGAFRRLREIMLAGKKYLTVIRFELIRLYEIQHSLRQLSYFDVFGRLRLTLQLARVTLSIPMAIDQAMKEPDGHEGNETEDCDGAEGEGRQTTDTRNQNVQDESDERPEEESDSDFDEDNGKSSDDELGNRRRTVPQRKRKASVEDFGMKADEEDEEEDAEGRSPGFSVADDEPSLFFGGSTAQAKRSARHARRRARVDARRQARLEAQEAKLLQRRGLLGPTAAGLLKGVVKVLETSESWVPGGGKSASDGRAHEQI